MAEQNDKKEKDPGLVDELEGAAYDALKHRRKFELQVQCFVSQVIAVCRTGVDQKNAGG